MSSRSAPSNWLASRSSAWRTRSAKETNGGQRGDRHHQCRDQQTQFAGVRVTAAGAQREDQVLFMASRCGSADRSLAAHPDARILGDGGENRSIGVMNQRLTDKPMTISAKVKLLPATKAPVFAN